MKARPGAVMALIVLLAPPDASAAEAKRGAASQLLPAASGRAVGAGPASKLSYADIRGRRGTTR